MNVIPKVVFVAALLVATPVFADVEISTQMLKNFQLPGTFPLPGAQLQSGGNDTTILTNSTGANPQDLACGVVIASDTSAVLHEYRYNDEPTACVSALPHPNGGVFLRVIDPTAEVGIVSGATAFLDADGQEQWVIPDQRLIDALPEPNGTGEFQGAYQQPDRVLAYSPRSDKLLAFTVGLLDLGLDQKFITQAHVVNVETGGLTVSGQTFGQSGVGFPGGAVVRENDGNFLVYYFSNGSQGAFFYDYDGRSAISFFNPRGEDWDDRFVLRMIYARDLLHLLWTESGEPGAETRITATTDTGAELWSSVFEAEYTFADGQTFLFGPPNTMWVGAEETAVLHQIEQMAFLRVVDINGESGGMARLDGVTEFAPQGIFTTGEGEFRLITFDDGTRTVFEHAMTFNDISDFDPENPPLPGDVSIPDIGISDVLEAAGCCATSSTKTPWTLFLLIAIVGFLRRRHART